MADGNVTTEVSRAIPQIYGPALMFGEDFLIPMVLDRDDLDATTLEDAAARLSHCAAAALHVARLRGENDNDMPRTLDGAIGAAEICMQLANGFTEAARQLKEEARHG